nr:MAG TPA: hypothetical protein [Caudoviricetes sp.]
MKLFKVPILRAFKNLALKFLTLIFYTPSHKTSQAKEIFNIHARASPSRVIRLEAYYLAKASPVKYCV